MMLRLCCSLCLGLLLSLSAEGVGAQPATAEQSLAEGNRLYSEGDYAGARNAYREALGTGYVNAALFYNLGNTYFRLDEIGQAVLHYEKARRLLPGDLRIEHNLDIARSRTADQLATVPDPYWTVWGRQILRVFGTSGLFYLGLFFYLIALALLTHRITTAARSPWLRRALTGSLVVGLFCIGAAYLTSISLVQNREAVVLASAVPLRPEPAAASTPERDIHEGLVIEILDTQAGWLNIRLPNGATGWIQTGTTADI